MAGTINLTTKVDTAVQVITIQLPGSQGVPGPQGVPGTAGTLAIGTVATGTPGSSAAATITGQPPNQVLNLTIPQGPTGPPGTPNTLTIGTVNTVAGTTGGSATITGTSPNQVLNLVLPRGYGVIPAGNAGDVLVKNTATDYDTKWSTPTSAATANALVQRDASGNAYFVEAVVTQQTSAGSATRKDYVDGKTWPSSAITDASSNSSGNGGKIVKWDAGGRIQAFDPSAAQDVATKNYVDVTAGTYNSDASSLMRRDSSGNTSLNLLSLGPQQNVANSATRKDYVDNIRRVFINQKTAAYTLAASDEGTMVYLQSSSAATFTVAPNATVPIPVGAFIDVCQNSTGALTIAGGAGVAFTYNALSVTSFTLAGANTVVRLLKTNTDSWYVYNLTEQDTGWIDMTSGMTAGATVGPEGAHYRVKNGVCYVQMIISASTLGAGATVYTLPATARPSYTHWFLAQYAQAFKGEIKVLSTGAIIIGVANAQFVASFSFPVG